MTDPLLEVRNLTIEFETETGRVRAVEDVSFTVDRGETVGLVGESGCGKTTTALGILRLLPPTGRIVSGEAIFDGCDLFQIGTSELRRLRWARLAMVFQGAMNALNPVQTVGAQIAEAIRLHAPSATARQATARAEDLLGLVGIQGGRARSYPHEYSGGMRQRAMVALALACDPDIIFADEPTTALDVMVQAQILELLADLQSRLGMGLVLVTHDLGVVAEVCDRVVVMYGGVVAEDATTEELFNAPRHPYTRLLLEASPDINVPRDRLTSIPGFPPRLDALPPGCRFEPRCPHAFERCRQAQPAAFVLGHRRRAACYLVEAAPS